MNFEITSYRHLGDISALTLFSIEYDYRIFQFNRIFIEKYNFKNRSTFPYFTQKGQSCYIFLERKIEKSRNQLYNYHQISQKYNKG